MKKNIFTIIMYTIGIAGLIITLFIVYKDINNSFATHFVLGYVIFLILFLIYFVVLFLLNLRNIKWVDVRKRIYKFVISFVFIGLLGFFYDHWKNPENINFYKILSTALAIALGSAFSDLPFVRNNK